MLHSMTGYGKARREQDGLAVEAEIRTVNHRFLDIALRAPQALFPFEGEVRRRVKARLFRGRVEVFLALVNRQEGARRVEVDQGLLEAYAVAIETLREKFGWWGQSDLGWLLTVPDLFTVTEASLDPATLETLVAGAVEEALDGVVAMRRREGQELEAQFRAGLARLREILGELRSLAPHQVESIRTRLTGRLADWLGDDLDPQRLAMEVALLAEKADIEEELNRLASHLDQLQEILDASSPPVGRRMDFLAQEIHRELNTIGAKAVSSAISERIIAGKVELEQLREQVQNIE